MKDAIDVIIQARLDSSRLPRKVLMPIGGKPLITHIVEPPLSFRIDPQYHYRYNGRLFFADSAYFNRLRQCKILCGKQKQCAGKILSGGEDVRKPCDRPRHRRQSADLP